MRSLRRQVTHPAYLAFLGVLLAICAIGCLCAQDFGMQGFTTKGTTIERLPPVENAPVYSSCLTYPAYGGSGYQPVPSQNALVPPANQGSYFAPQPTSPNLGPVFPQNPPETVPLPVPQPQDHQAAAEEKTETKSQEPSSSKSDDDDVDDLDKHFQPGLLPSPLYFHTDKEELQWVNEVRPGSMLVRATRYLSRYVGKWEGGIQLGIDGTSGSSETFNVAFGVNGKREINQATFQFDIDYKRNNSEGSITANRLFFNCRYENPYNEGRWHLFVQDEVTYDEFQPWNLQVAVSSGVGHYLWNNEKTKLQGLWGGGFSQDIGGTSDEEYVPEMHLGLNGEHKFNKLQKLTTSCNYYPDATDFSSSRIVNKLSWEVILDEEVNLSMKFNITDRLYCPNPGGKENDLDYAMLLMWKF